MSHMEQLAEVMKVLSLMSDEDLDTPEGLAAFAEIYNGMAHPPLDLEHDNDGEVCEWVLEESRFLHLVEVLKLDSVYDLLKYSEEELRVLWDEHHDAYFKELRTDNKRKAEDDLAMKRNLRLRVFKCHLQKIIDTNGKKRGSSKTYSPLEIEQITAVLKVISEDGW